MRHATRLYPGGRPSAALRCFLGRVISCRITNRKKKEKKKGGKRSTYGPVINTTDETLLFAFVSAPALLPNTRQPF